MHRWSIYWAWAPSQDHHRFSYWILAGPGNLQQRLVLENPGRMTASPSLGIQTASIGPLGSKHLLAVAALKKMENHHLSSYSSRQSLLRQNLRGHVIQEIVYQWERSPRSGIRRAHIEGSVPQLDWQRLSEQVYAAIFNLKPKFASSANVRHFGEMGIYTRTVRTPH